MNMMTDLTTKKIPVSCNKDCGGGCPLLAYVKDGRVIKIVNNPLGNRHMSGCVKGFQMTKVLYSAERLKKPLLRKGARGSGDFEEVPWSEALDIVAEKLNSIKEKHGNQAILSLGGSGACRGALHNTIRLPLRFLNLFGGHTSTYGSYSAGATEFTTPHMIGRTWTGIDPATLLKSNMIILWGANIADCRFGCELYGWLGEARKKGVDVVVIDPRRSATVSKLATKWIPIRPGTDSAMMMAVLYVLVTEDLIDSTFIDTYSVGFDELKRYVLGSGDDGQEAKTPLWAEDICGTPASLIVEFARQYGRAKPSALIPGLSIQRTIGGEEAVRLSIVLQVATGNLGKMGGSSGGLTWDSLPRPRMKAIKIPPNPIVERAPTYLWPDMVLNGTAGGYPCNIKAIYNVGGNYIVQGSDVRKSIRAFESVEFSVCHDYFLTPTAAYCDVVLPVTTFLERGDIVFSGGNYLLFSNQVSQPLPESKNDYDIFSDLAYRLGFGEAFTEGKNEEDWLREFIASSEITDPDEFKRTGIYYGKDQLRVGLSDFIEDPETNPLSTPSGKIEISSKSFGMTGFSPIPEVRILEPTRDYPLRLISPKSRFRIHSQFSNIPLAGKRERHDLWINPVDAKKRGIINGQTILVNSPEGRVKIKARVTGEILQGVVCLLEGLWPCFNSHGVETSGSVNVLTSTEPTEPSRASRTHSVLVEVTGL
jgi:anaerobic dimethyl sulfoxide reductase subunit A